MLLVVRHLLLEAMHLFLVAYCFYLNMVSNSVLLTTSKALVSTSFLFLLRPGAPSSFLLLVVRHFLLEAMHLFLVVFCFFLNIVSNSVLVTTSKALVSTSLLFLLVRPGAPSSFLPLVVRHLFLLASCSY